MNAERIQELRALADQMERYDQGGGASEEIRELCSEVERLTKAHCESVAGVLAFADLPKHARRAECLACGAISYGDLGKRCPGCGHAYVQHGTRREDMRAALKDIFGGGNN